MEPSHWHDWYPMDALPMPQSTVVEQIAAHGAAAERWGMERLASSQSARMVFVLVFGGALRSHLLSEKKGPKHGKTGEIGRAHV